MQTMRDIELHPTDKDTNSIHSARNTLPQNVVAVEAPTALTRQVIWKLLSAGFSFFCAGMNDGSLGPLIPYILRTYHMGTTSVAIIYAAAFVGWLVAAVTNSHMLKYLDTGAILAVGAGLQLLSHILRFWAPPFGLFATTFFVASLGIAYQDSHSNTFVTTVKVAHRWLGFIHAMYALGALVSPFVATAIASSIPRWNLFYTCLIGLAVVNLTFVLIAFRDSLHMSPKRAPVPEEGPRTGKSKEALQDMLEILKLPGVWLLSLFFFFYLGVGITAGGWVTEYLVTIRHGDLADMGYIPAGLYGGIFLGRLLLAEPTYRWGERRMLLLYSAIILGLQLIFWLVPNIIANAVVLSVMGFFFGPFFATGISIGSKLFPKRIQPAALGLVFVLAQAGGSLFPSITGVIAGRVGVQVLQPILVGLIVAMGISWALVPKVSKNGD